MARTLCQQTSVELDFLLDRIQLALAQDCSSDRRRPHAAALSRAGQSTLRLRRARDHERRSFDCASLRPPEFAVVSTLMTIELTQLTDEALLAETTRVAELERRATSELLVLLVEVERRGLHLALGHSSMFGYCTRALHLSEQAAYSRITAARAARRFPIILVMLADGALSLSSITILAPHLTEETCDALLEAARHKSTRDVERMLASAFPQPDIPARIRAVPEEKSVGLLALAPADASSNRPATAFTPIKTAPPTVAPIAPRRYLLKLVIGDDPTGAGLCQRPWRPATIFLNARASWPPSSRTPSRAHRPLRDSVD